MDEEKRATLRLDCLRLAVVPTVSNGADSAVENAKKFAAFVLGEEADKPQGHTTVAFDDEGRAL